VLLGPAGGPAKPLTTTLSLPVQAAAQAAVDSAPKGAILVAIQPSTGEILAVAQNSAAGDKPAALNGMYPPGSTFKIATATAALQNGVGPDTVLPCPGKITIGTRTIPNADFELAMCRCIPRSRSRATPPSPRWRRNCRR